MIAAIMQPTFLPWMGYFGMIERADVFVFFDSVQFSKRSWQQRNRIKTANGELMLTLPISSKGKQDQLIQDVELQAEHYSPKKFLGTITQNYAKAPYYAEYFPGMARVFEAHTEKLADLNIALIEHFCTVLGIKTRTLRSSTLGIHGVKADLLSDICLHLKADQYLSAPGSKEYLDESTAFAVKSIEISYHQYAHPTYHQLWGEFLPYMAILDLLFNEGPNSLKLIKQGYGA